MNLIAVMVLALAAILWISNRYRYRERSRLFNNLLNALCAFALGLTLVTTDWTAMNSNYLLMNSIVLVLLAFTASIAVVEMTGTWHRLSKMWTRVVNSPKKAFSLMILLLLIATGIVYLAQNMILTFLMWNLLILSLTATVVVSTMLLVYLLDEFGTRLRTLADVPVPPAILSIISDTAMFSTGLHSTNLQLSGGACPHDMTWHQLSVLLQTALVEWITSVWRRSESAIAEQSGAALISPNAS